MLPSRLSSIVGTNVFKEIWIAHRNLGFSRISTRRKRPFSNQPIFDYMSNSTCFQLHNYIYFNKFHVARFTLQFNQFFYQASKRTMLTIATNCVATPLWDKCEGEAHTPESGKLESSGTPENSELELKGQNTLHWGVLDVIGKLLKCRCLNWPRIGHLDICSPSYRQKKGRESNQQFDSRPLKVGNQPLPDVCSRSATWR